MESLFEFRAPNIYNKTEINSMLTGVSTDLSNYYNKTQVDAIVANNNFSYYTKSEIDDLDNELSTLILNTYTK